jgi:hypothetical protein
MYSHPILPELSRMNMRLGFTTEVVEEARGAVARDRVAATDIAGRITAAVPAIANSKD